MSNVKTRILLRSDIAANWSSVNPVLLKGEVGVCYDPSVEAESRKIKFKIGDGVKHWNDLEFIADYDGKIKDLSDAIDLLNGTEEESGSVAAQIKAALDEVAGKYQEKLPEVGEEQYDKYLHANKDTGALEWVYVEQGAANWGHIGGNIADQEDLVGEFAKKQDSITEDNKLGADLIAESDDKKFISAAELEKLADVEDGAEENVIDKITVNGVELEPTGKTVAITDVASKAALEALTEVVGDDSKGLVKEVGLKANAADVYTKTETYTKEEVDTAIAAVPKISYTFEAKGEAREEVEFNKCRKVFLEAGESLESDVYNEFICVKKDEAYVWEKLGNTKVDLTDYRKAEDQDEIDAKKLEAYEITVNGAAGTYVGEANVPVFFELASEGENVKVNAYNISLNTNKEQTAFVTSMAIPNATGENTGLLSKSDYSKFAGKQNSLTTDEGLKLENDKLGLDFYEVILGGGSAADWGTASEEVEGE